MKKPRQVLITNVHSAENLGDRAILEATLEAFQQALPNPTLVVSTNYPKEDFFQQGAFQVVPSPWVLVGRTAGRGTAAQIVGFMEGVGWAFLARLWHRRGRPLPGIIPNKWREVFQVYLESDLVAGIGGNQFYSSGRFGWPLPLNALSVWLAHHFGKAFCTLPQSIGPLKRKWERRLLGKLYRQNAITFLRDTRSLELARALDLPQETIAYAPDMAFRRSPCSRAEALAKLVPLGFAPDQKAVGMTIIAPMGHALDSDAMKRYYAVLADTIERVITDLECEVFLFRQVSGPSDLENDGLANVRVAESLTTGREHVHILNETLPPDLLRACYREMDLFIASRLHSGIFALCEGVPTIFIGYLSKTMGLLRALGLAAWGIPLSELTQRDLWDVLEALWSKRAAHRETLARLMPETMQSVEKVVPAILEKIDQKDTP
jgi:polysaccharide pyruvyl transferase WcaK-like protein